MRMLVLCLLYFALIGASGFIIGRLVPKRLFRWDRRPFTPFKWEKGGSVYNALGIRHWKELLPDMSRILPKVMPSKKLPVRPSKEHVELMIEETCVAETTHAVLSLLGFGAAVIWRGVWGWLLSILYFLGNLPYILIQRYNRPKLVRIHARLAAGGQSDG